MLSQSSSPAIIRRIPRICPSTRARRASIARFDSESCRIDLSTFTIALLTSVGSPEYTPAGIRSRLVAGHRLPPGYEYAFRGSLRPFEGGMDEPGQARRTSDAARTAGNRVNFGQSHALLDQQYRRRIRRRRVSARAGLQRRGGPRDRRRREHTLTDSHWLVVRYLREKFRDDGH